MIPLHGILLYMVHFLSVFPQSVKVLGTTYRLHYLSPTLYFALVEASLDNSHPYIVFITGHISLPGHFLDTRFILSYIYTI